MPRRPSRVLALLLLLASSTALARSKTPPPDTAPDTSERLQLIGWSRDEKRFALRVYELPESLTDDLSEPPPYCPGYVDHRGKKFRGAQLIQLYEDSAPTGTWSIQERQPCTPPELARNRLAQAKAALVQHGVDLSATGAVVSPPRKKRKPPAHGKSWTRMTTTALVLPSGPWARQTVEVIGRAEADAHATFKVRLRSGKHSTPLGEFTLGPSEWPAMTAANWTPTVGRLFLSPSGKSFVLLARMEEASLGGGASSVVLGRVELPERPESVLSASATTR